MIYYVSASTISGGTGTLSNPFSSLQRAHDLAKPGDTIEVRGGTYFLAQPLKFTSDGTADKPITVENYNGEKVVIDAGKTTGGFALTLNSASYNHIKGLEIKNGGEGGVCVTGASNGNQLELLNIHHNGRTSQYDGKGFVVYGSSANNLILNVDSHDNRDLAGDNADGFQIATTGVGNVVRGCRAWNNADDGFDLFNVQNNTTSGAVTLRVIMLGTMATILPETGRVTAMDSSSAAPAPARPEPRAATR
ncbi:right-handed parallel beta-helix repeat-containing protein [Belnapia sp. T18]|uniref:Right-handed parallel beta-helix repeat-containing protein n=1 Tax=Belnapia arida TaxID=2804533 RepID=A0ABS1U934_9PROT|nr:right-handed parallel beta-helix repeat-containing protein [Belnapia arida]MBL6081185.1 right-handed parallel beta-helix repeat-containing protein [Belnapia arida]